MRILLSLVTVVALLAGASFVGDPSAFTSEYQQTSPPNAATVGTWVNIGPAPLSYAPNPSNPDGFNSGRVAAIAVDPSNPLHWLIGAGNGGVWESLDGGTSWLPIADSAPTLATGAVAFAPGDPRIIYVGTANLRAWGSRTRVSAS